MRRKHFLPINSFIIFSCQDLALLEPDGPGRLSDVFWQQQLMQSVLKPLASGRLQRSVKLTSVELHTFWIFILELVVFSSS